MIITILNNIWIMMSTFFSAVFDAIFVPVWDLLEANSNPFTEWLLGLFTFVGLESLLSTFTLGTLIFGFATVVILVIYFFLP